MFRDTVRLYKRVVWVQFVGQTMTSLGGFMIIPFITLYMYKQLHIGLLSTMAVASAAPLVGMLTSIVAGTLSDRVGRKSIMVSSLFGQGISMILFTFVHNAWQSALITMLNGAVSALYSPVANAQIADVVPVEKRGEVYSLLHMGLNVGAALGPIIGAVFFQHHAVILFLIGALCTISTGVLIWMLYPSLQHACATNKTAGKTVSVSNIFKFGKSIKEDIPVIWIALLALPVALLYAQVRTTLPIYLSTHFTNYIHIFATIKSFNAVVVILLQVVIGRLSRNRSLWILVAISFFAFGVVGFGYAYSVSLQFLLVTEFIFTIGEMIGLPQLQHIIGLLAPKERRGFAFAIYAARNNISGIIGPIAGGIVMRDAGGQVLFSSLGVLILISGLSLVILIRSILPKLQA